MIRAFSVFFVLVAVGAVVGCAGRVASVACVRDDDCDGVCVQGACVDGIGEGEGEEGEGEEGEGDEGGEGEGEGEEGEGEEGEGEGEGEVDVVITAFGTSTATVDQNSAAQLRWTSNGTACDVFDVDAGVGLGAGAGAGALNIGLRAGPRTFTLTCNLGAQRATSTTTVTPLLPASLDDSWVRTALELRVELTVTSPDIEQPPLFVDLPLARVLRAANLPADFDRNTIRVVFRDGAQASVDAYFDDDVLFFAYVGQGTYDVFCSATPGQAPSTWVTRNTSTTASVYDGSGGDPKATFAADLNWASPSVGLFESGLRVETSSVHRSGATGGSAFDPLLASRELMATPELGVYATDLSAGDVDVRSYAVLDDRARAIRLLTRITARVDAASVGYSRFADFDLLDADFARLDDPGRCDDTVCVMCGDNDPEVCSAWVGVGANEARVGPFGSVSDAWRQDTAVTTTNVGEADNAMRLRWILPAIDAGKHVDVNELFLLRGTSGNDLNDDFNDTFAAARDFTAATTTIGAVWFRAP